MTPGVCTRTHYLGSTLRALRQKETPLLRLRRLCHLPNPRCGRAECLHNHDLPILRRNVRLCTPGHRRRCVGGLLGPGRSRVRTGPVCWRHIHRPCRRTHRRRLPHAKLPGLEMDGLDYLDHGILLWLSRCRNMSRVIRARLVATEGREEEVRDAELGHTCASGRTRDRYERNCQQISVATFQDVGFGANPDTDHNIHGLHLRRPLPILRSLSHRVPRITRLERRRRCPSLPRHHHRSHYRRWNHNLHVAFSIPAENGREWRQARPRGKTHPHDHRSLPPTHRSLLVRMDQLAAHHLGTAGHCRYPYRSGRADDLLARHQLYHRRVPYVCQQRHCG